MAPKTRKRTTEQTSIEEFTEPEPRKRTKRASKSGLPADATAKLSKAKQQTTVEDFGGGKAEHAKQKASKPSPAAKKKPAPKTPAAKASKPAPAKNEPDAPTKASGSKSGASPANKGGTVTVNRAPVLTLWVSVVAQRQGHDRDAALTFGRAVSGLLAHSKGVHIGMVEPRERDDSEREARAKRETERGIEHVDVFGMKVKAVKEADAWRAVDADGKPTNPRTLDGYLHRAFGDQLDAVQAAFEELAEAYSSDELPHEAYNLYAKFRPQVPGGQKGWGHKGVLDLGQIHELAQDAGRRREP